MDSNPFADPSEISAAQASARPTSGVRTGGLEDYQPFTGDKRAEEAKPAAVITPQPSDDGRAAILAGQQALQKQQQELERKEAELRDRETRIKNMETNTKTHNWPPLPQWCPVQPCFYQDISIEIPQQFQRIVRLMYYLWLLYTATLLLNVIASMVYFTAGGGGLSGGTQFGVAIIQMALFTPCSYMLWFRPLYRAFRSDSSFNFMLFFFIISAQLVFTAVQSIGFSSFGTCGWINAIAETPSYPGVGILMFIVAALFTVCGVGMLLGLFRVHALYRSTGASFSKAQQEFNSGVLSNRHVQNAAASAVQSQFSGSGGDTPGGGQRY